MSSFPLAPLALIEGHIGAISAAALGTVCLIQYAMQLRVRRLAGQQHATHQREMSELTTEVQYLQKDRTLTRLENQVLREVVSQAEFSQALGLLLRRFVPNPSQGFAAFLQLDESHSPWTQTRGLSDESRSQIRVSDRVLERLVQGQTVVLEGAELRNSLLYTALAPVDQAKAKQLFVIGVGQPPQLFGVLATTALIPSGLPAQHQLELTQRLMQSVAGSLKQSLLLERQRNQLRSTREMLDLRSVADAKYDTPVLMVEAFIQRLTEIIRADRAALFLLTREVESIGKPLVRCGQPLPVGIENRWQEHEASLAQAGLIQNEVTSFDQRSLNLFGIDTLFGAALSAPLVQARRTIGVLCLSRRKREPFADDVGQLVQWATEYLGDTIVRVLNYAAIERQARQDSLTELANRRTFDQHLEREVDIAGGSNTPCSLLLVDLDRFKQVNDNYGHQTGDEVLKATARTMRDMVMQIRSNDRVLLARYGGEEMAILLPGIGIAGATRIGESIRQAIEALHFDHNGTPFSVTLSIGIATFPLHARNPSELIAAADTALYEAKEGGRNRVNSPSRTLKSLV